MKGLILIIILMLSHCNSSVPSVQSMSNAECALTYDTNEALFSDNDTLIIGVNIIHFMNNDTFEYDANLLERQLNLTSLLFDKAKIKFKLVSFTNVKGVPSDNLELSATLKTKVLSYDISNYQFFSMMMNEPHVINVYIYNQSERSTFAGVAGGIGSDYLAIRKDYFDRPTRTLAHEFGHCLGLYHTHQSDDTDGYNIYNGDKVCDTPSSISLSGKVDKECNLDKSIDTLADSIQLMNIMSYSYPFCRENFTDNQIQRMRWFIEQSKDLQSVLYNRHELINRRLEQTYININ